MWGVISCIVYDHDLRLVALAALICAVTAVTAIRFRRKAARSEGGAAWLWIALTGFVAGGGVWATHFIAMLAYERDLPFRYDLWMTIASWAVGVAGMGAGFALSARMKNGRGALLGGALVGLGVIGLHYVGMAAVKSVFEIRWDWAYVAASAALSCAGGAAALFACTRLSGLKSWIVPPLLLVLGIVGLHFTGMTAVELVPNLTAALAPEVIGREALAVLVGSMAFLLLLAAGAMAIVETLSRASGLKSIQAAFRHVPAGLALYDRDDRLVVWNDAYANMLSQHGIVLEGGRSRSEISLAIVASGNSGMTEETRHEWLSGATTSGERVVPEWSLPDGSWRRVEMKPVPGGGSITVLTDITDIRRTAAEMADAVDRAHAASRAKSDFLANMSHEIRTPLNGVLGMAQVMDADELSPPQRERLAVIRDSGTALLGILNDILDLSKVQAGKLDLERAPFDVLQLANATLAAFQGAAAAKGVGLAVDFDPDTQRGWNGDALRLRQVLSNLLGNALKFTTEGTVRLEVASQPGRLILRVRDTGIGMDEDQIPRLFEKFSQADSTTTRRYGGTGLGLAICQELIDLMGGTIEVTSQRGRGSCFTVSVPLEPAAMEIEAPEPEFVAPAADPAETLKILAAEDNRTNQIVLRSLLQPLGAELTIAENGKEALAAFRADRFDVVLMDAQMPEMNGVEATLAIRAFEAEHDRARTPIVALSANVMKHQIEEYFAAGMDGWVAKPIELSALFAAIEQALAGEQDAKEVVAA